MPTSEDKFEGDLFTKPVDPLIGLAAKVYLFGLHKRMECILDKDHGESVCRSCCGSLRASLRAAPFSFSPE